MWLVFHITVYHIMWLHIYVNPLKNFHERMIIMDDIVFAGGFYIYSEGNSYLVSSQLSLSINTSYCLSFWYFVYGKTPSLTLSVYVGREQAYSRPEWSRHVSGGSRTHRWNIGEVDIELRAPLQVIFSTQSSNNMSGTALDDISISEGSCSGSKLVFSYVIFP